MPLYYYRDYCASGMAEHAPVAGKDQPGLPGSFTAKTDETQETAPCLYNSSVERMPQHALAFRLGPPWLHAFFLQPILSGGESRSRVAATLRAQARLGAAGKHLFRGKRRRNGQDAWHGAAARPAFPI